MLECCRLGPDSRGQPTDLALLCGPRRHNMAIEFEKLRRRMLQERRAQRDAAKAAAVASPTPSSSSKDIGAGGGTIKKVAEAADAADAAASRDNRGGQLVLGPATRVGAGVVDFLHYVPGWLSEAEACALEQALPAADSKKWSRLAHRRLLNCGGVPHPSGMIEEELPPWFGALRERLLAEGVFSDPANPPNQVLLNEYSAEDPAAGGSGGGGIAPHNDGPLFAPRVAIVSLGAPAVLHFWEPPPPAEKGDEGGVVGAASGWDAVRVGGGSSGAQPQQQLRPPLCSVLLLPRSLLLFGGDHAYGKLLHGIYPASADVLGPSVCNLAACGGSYRVGDAVARGQRRRLSLTVRTVTHVAKPLGSFLTTDDEAEMLRRWAWWRRAISDHHTKPAEF
jgi:alkylated DNA repair protein alkB family protein 6